MLLPVAQQLFTQLVVVLPPNLCKVGCCFGQRGHRAVFGCNPTSLFLLAGTGEAAHSCFHWSHFAMGCEAHKSKPQYPCCDSTPCPTSFHVAFVVGHALVHGLCNTEKPACKALE
jgi:hypothetical protein